MIGSILIEGQEVTAIALPFMTLFVGWATYVTKMLWKISRDVEVRSARQDTTLDDHERRIGNIEDTLYR
tara:strand:+ start:1517 stop:1723 length:207 start_codon:yes stop_codon:yes gene_type:complete